MGKVASTGNCVCVCERASERVCGRETNIQSERERAREAHAGAAERAGWHPLASECVTERERVCVCVCERERHLQPPPSGQAGIHVRDDQLVSREDLSQGHLAVGFRVQGLGLRVHG